MKKNYIVDTNVLIDNPNSLQILRNGEENEIFLSLYVILELDHLKTHKKIGGSVREAIQNIIECKDWINITYDDNSIAEFERQFDGKIIKELNSNKEEKILISNDKIMRLIAEKVYKIKCDEFQDANPYLTNSEAYTGFIEVENSKETNHIINSFYWENGKPVFNSFNGPKVIGYENIIWKIKPRNIYQNLAFELLINNDINIVTLQSQAGLGKSFLALAAAFHLCFQEKNFKKIIITKGNYEIDKELGSLPGDLDDKFKPIIRPITDLVYKLHKIKPANRLFIKDSEEKKFDINRIEFLPLNYIQGMNLEDCILIIDEGQNLTRKTMRTVCTRCGENTRLFVIGDTRQVINPFINEYNNGLNWLVKLCAGQPDYGHLVLKGKNSRGPVTDLILKVGL